MACSQLSGIAICRKKKSSTRSMGEDGGGWDIDAGWLDEVVITPDPLPEPDPGWDVDGGWLDDVDVNAPYPDPDPDPPYEDPYEDDYYSGGDSSQEEEENETDDQKLESFLKQAASTLKEKGINIDKYKIQMNKSTCLSNARTLPDGTIELCQGFWEYPLSDRLSILWHEIYHTSHAHHNTSSATSSNEISLTPTEEAKENLNIYVEWAYKGLSEEFLDYIEKDMLCEFNVRNDSQWYINEIGTYKAELNNGIEKSVPYESLIEFMLWKYEEVLEFINKKE